MEVTVGFFRTANSGYEITLEGGRYKFTKVRDFTGNSPRVLVGDSRYGNRFMIEPDGRLQLFDGRRLTLNSSPVTEEGIVSEAPWRMSPVEETILLPLPE